MEANTTHTENTTVALRVPQMAQLEETAARALAQATTFEVATTEDVALAGDAMKECNRHKNSAEQFRRALTDPLREHQANINAAFKTITEPLDLARKLLSEKIGAFNEAQRRCEREAERKRQEIEAREAEEKAAALEAAGQSEAAEAVIEKTIEHQDARQQVAAQIAAQPKRAFGGASMVSERRTWEFEVTDIRKVPVQYLTVDESAVKQEIRRLAAIQTANGTPVEKVADEINASASLPGIRAYQKRTTFAR